MPIGEKQALITEIVETVLGEPAQSGKTFTWLKNQHVQEDFQFRLSLIDHIFKTLEGSSQVNKKVQLLRCDAYFGGSFNFIFELDELQHFSTARLKTCELYPSDLQIAFDIQKYQLYCQMYHEKADKYRRSKTTVDFNFIGGRTAQRAYLDCFRDILPPLHGLNPTIRIAEFEIEEVTKNDKHSQTLIGQLLSQKLPKSLWAAHKP